MNQYPRWYVKWLNDYGFGYGLSTINALHNMSLEAYGITAHESRKSDIICNMLKMDIVNATQTANLTHVSKQHVYDVMEARRISHPSHTVRGRISYTGLTYIREIVTRLVGHDMPLPELLIEAQEHADKSIIHHLSGVPIHVLAGAKIQHETKHYL